MTKLPVRYYTEDSGGGSGGGSDDPFASIDLTILDEDTAKTVKAIQEKYKETQTKQATLEEQIASLQKAQRQQQESPKPQQVQVDPYEAAALKVLRDSGIPEEQLKQNLPFAINMLKAGESMAATKLGNEFAPIAATVVQQQNVNAYNEVASHEKFGQMLAIPVVAQQVQNWINECTKQGQQLTPEAIANFAKMPFYDFSSEEQIAQPPTKTPMNTPKFSSGFMQPVSPITRQMSQNSPQAARPSEAVNGALELVFHQMGSDLNIYPKAFTPKAKGK